MSSIKKRKHQISDSDEDEPIVINDSSDEDVKPRKKSSTATTNGKSQKRKKRIAVIDSDEDDDKSDDGSISINDIKKKAKSKAKKLAQGNDSSDDAKPAKASSKTPPAPKQSNTLFNYFKPKPTTSTTGEKGKDDKKDFTKVKEKVSVSDDFMTTTISKDSKVESKSDTSKPKESPKTVSTKDKEKPMNKVKEESPKSSKSKEDEPRKSKADSPVKTKTATGSSKSKEFSKVTTSTKDEFKTTKVTTTEPAKNKKESDDASSKSKTSPKKSPKKEPVKAKEPKSREPPVEALPRIVEAKRISDLWVDKYKPQSTKSIIGQQGDKSPMNKLIKWLRDWHKNLDKKPAYNNNWNNDGAGYRAALLSGPPGIGKTTTAQLVCKELGYDYMELNASDARNKKSLQEVVQGLLGNTKLTNFFKPADSNNKPGSSNDQKLTAKHCVIMDEVDGMAGNEDRGGVAELIQLIKKSKVPIICICNDRGDQKMRTLVNYCFDLRFPKPRIEQLKGPLMSIAFKENVKISPNVLNDLIASSNYDIRQCVHNLSMLAAGHTTVKDMINSNQNAKPIKDVKLGPFDAIKKVFATGQEYAQMSFADKSDLFFADYGIMPLFVYENYNQINLASKEPSVGKQLKRLMQSIEAISFGDLLEKEIRTNQNWSLLPMQAAFSTVMPGAYMRSENGLGFPGFPQFMGKLSTTNKNARLVDEIVSHMTLSITGTRSSFALDYLQPLKDSLVTPLLNSDKGGVSSVLDLMSNYSITKDNMDAILELGLWSGEDDPMKKVDSKTKAALTRAYNKTGFALPYATENDIQKVTKRGAKAAGGKGGKKSKAAKDNDDSEGDSDVGEDEEENMDLYY